MSEWQFLSFVRLCFQCVACLGSLLRIYKFWVEFQKGILNTISVQLFCNHIVFLMKDDIAMLVHEIKIIVHNLWSTGVYLNLDLANHDIVLSRCFEPFFSRLPLTALTVNFKNVDDSVLVAQLLYHRAQGLEDISFCISLVRPKAVLMVGDFPTSFFGTLCKVSKVKGVDVTILMNVLVNVLLKCKVIVGTNAVHQATTSILHLFCDPMGVTDPFPTITLFSNSFFVKTDKVGFVVALKETRKVFILELVRAKIRGHVQHFLLETFPSGGCDIVKEVKGLALGQ